VLWFFQNEFSWAAVTSGTVTTHRLGSTNCRSLKFRLRLPISLAGDQQNDHSDKQRSPN
jgi:hypothetical protein